MGRAGEVASYDAGDGYAYVPYTYGTFYVTGFPTPGHACAPGYGTAYLNLLRIDTSVNATVIPLVSWYTYLNSCLDFQEITPTSVSLITNADQDVLASWQVLNLSETPGDTSPRTANSSYLAITNGTSVVAQTSTPNFVTPVLQAQDGTFYGSDTNGNLLHIDQSGNITWGVPGDTPEIATADGGVIGTSGITYDSYGNATGSVGYLPIQSWTGNGYTVGLNQVASTLPDYASSFAVIQGGNPSAASPAPQSQFAPAPSSGPYIQSLGSIFRSTVASLAKGFVGDSTDWPEHGSTTCNQFVQSVLNDASNQTQLNIPYPVRPNLAWYQLSYRHPFLAADWANPTMDGGCWKPLPSGPDGALPGDVIATGWPPNGNDGTGHVGIVVEPNAGAPNFKDASAGDVPPYWWTPEQKQSFIPGTITLTDYGFRLPGFDFTNPNDVQGLKKDSHVRRFECY
jgi:hypothetical protein